MNNPPAFPHTVEGMTLRDYFAAKAIQGICANPKDIHVFEDETYEEYIDEIARCSYKIADAMLKAGRLSTSLHIPTRARACGVVINRQHRRTASLF
jgi:hypothetical protein